MPNAVPSSVPSAIAVWQDSTTHSAVHGPESTSPRIAGGTTPRTKPMFGM